MNWEISMIWILWIILLILYLFFDLITVLKSYNYSGFFLYPFDVEIRVKFLIYYLLQLIFSYNLILMSACDVRFISRFIWKFWMILRLNASIQMSDFIAEKRLVLETNSKWYSFLRKFYCFLRTMPSNHAFTQIPSFS